MTYQEKISEMLKTATQLYDDAEWLRDIADENEKKHWNDFRRLTYEVDAPLRKLLREIGNRRNMEL